MDANQFLEAVDQLGSALSPEHQAQRRFYVFNDHEEVAKHVSQIETIADLMQLRLDIEMSKTNLTKFQVGAEGIWAIGCLACSPTQRHLFITAQKHDELQGLTEAEQAGIATLTILKAQ